NDLDVDTLRALEDALLDFAGCAVVISHDRWFLDRVATHILAFEGDSQAVWFEGAYDEYELDRRRRLGDEAAQPHRIKYKPLVRQRLTQLIVRERHHAAVGVMDHGELVGTEQPRRDDQRADGVVGRTATCISNHVSIADRESKCLLRMDTRVHAGQDRDVPGG